MIGLYTFILISIPIYIFIFFIMPKLKFPKIIEIFVASFVVGGSYLNIAGKGNTVSWLNIELTETIRWVSMAIVVIYLISAWFVFIKPKDDDWTRYE